MNKFLKDVKEIVYPNIKTDDSVYLIMYFFADKNKIDLEDCDYAKKIYETLNWENERFDVISSFWITFSRIMNYVDSERYSLAKSGNVKIYKNHYKNEKYECDSFPEKIIKKKDATALQDLEKSKKLFDKLIEFASVCHSVANFMPCPEGYQSGELSYNQAKGLLQDVQDYFNLMIDKIQKCIDNDEQMELNQGKQNVSITTIRKWHKWFLNEENREKYCIEDYYKIDKLSNRIIGLPLFKNQSLDKPFPNGEEISQCIEEIIERIQKRAGKLDERINKGLNK